MNELVGRQVYEVWVGPEEQDIHFKTDVGWRSWTTDGECCSETWFADIYGIEALLGQIVVKALDLEMPQVQDDRGRQESDSFYGVALKTEQGVTTIAYRNSSNGCYGGSIDFAEDKQPAHGSVQIVGDWSA